MRGDFILLQMNLHTLKGNILESIKERKKIKEKLYSKTLSKKQIEKYKQERHSWIERLKSKDKMFKKIKIHNPVYILKFILKKKNLVPWVPNKKYVEIEITTKCSLACFNCDRSVRQAPSNEDMSCEQIEKFVNESIKLNWEWKRIRLMGGEPTLHPHFFKILKIVRAYKDFNPRCVIEISTNGYGIKVNEVLSKLPNWVNVRNSKKESNIHEFSSYNMAPIDLEEFKNADFSKGCWVTETCGLGLTKYGYYPCGPGASADRIFGFNIGLKKLSSVNDLTLKNQLKLLCKYCGHYKDNYDAERITEEKMSVSWQKAYEKYKKRKPNLFVFLIP